MGILGCCKKKPKQQVNPSLPPPNGASPLKAHRSTTINPVGQPYLKAPLDEGFAGSPEHWKMQGSIRAEPGEFKFPKHSPESPKLIGSGNNRPSAPQILGSKSKVAPKMILRPQEDLAEDKTLARKFHQGSEQMLQTNNTIGNSPKRGDLHLSPKRFRTTLAHRMSNGGKNYVIVVGEHPGEDGLAIRRKSSPAKEVNQILKLRETSPPEDTGSENVEPEVKEYKFPSTIAANDGMQKPIKVPVETEMLQRQLKMSRLRTPARSGTTPIVLENHELIVSSRGTLGNKSKFTPSESSKNDKGLAPTIPEIRRNLDSKDLHDGQPGLNLPKSMTSFHLNEGSAINTSMQRYSNSQNRGSQTLRESFDKLSNDDSLYMSRMMLSPPANNTRNIKGEFGLRGAGSGSDSNHAASEGKELDFSPGLPKRAVNNLNHPSNKTLNLPGNPEHYQISLLDPGNSQRGEHSDGLALRQARSASPKAHVGRITGYRTLPYQKLLSQIMSKDRLGGFGDRNEVMDISEGTQNNINKTTNVSKAEGDNSPMVGHGSGSGLEHSHPFDKNTSVEKRSAKKDTLLTANHTLGMPPHKQNTGSSKSFVFDEDQMLHRHDYSVLDFSIAGMSAMPRDRRKMKLKDSKSRFNRTLMSQSVLGGPDGEEEVRQNKDLNTTYIQHTETVNPKKMRDYGCVASGTRTKINQYILLTQIGKGGWGEVFLSVDTNSKHKYVADSNRRR